MTIAWMLYALAVGALICIAAVSAEWALKSAKQPVRFVWATAIALTFVFTLVAPLRAPKVQNELALPAMTMVAVPTVAVAEQSFIQKLETDVRAALDLLAMPVQKSMDVVKAVPALANVSAGAIWLLSTVIALVVLFTVYTRSMRESLRWPRMNVLGRTVRVAPDVGPAVMGMAPPEIVIPHWVLKRNTEEQQLVLEHESEHVRAHDPLLLVFACVAVALMPWNAAVWFMWSRLRLAVELDCDRRVLMRGVQKPAYGELLVELSSQRPWNSLAMPAFSWGASHLEKRLVAMTARPVRFRFARSLASAGVIAVALVAACQSEMPTAAQVKAMDVAAITARVPLSDSTVYFVNERKVSSADANAVIAEDIGSIEVKRATKKSPVSEVHVTLKGDSMRVVLDSPILGSVSEDHGRKPQFKITRDDSGSLQLRASRDLSKVAPLKAAAMANASYRTTTDDQAPASVSDSSTKVSATSVVVSDRPCTVAPGEARVLANGSRIRIRGQASTGLNGTPTPCATGKPLFVVDGVVMPDDAQMDGIKPDAIERIEVIKGPLAINQYGSRAANGVILITMRK